MNKLCTIRRFYPFEKFEKCNITVGYVGNGEMEYSLICRFKAICLCIFNENPIEALTCCGVIDTVRFFRYNNNDVNFL